MIEIRVWSDSTKAGDSPYELFRIQNDLAKDLRYLLGYAQRKRKFPNDKENEVDDIQGCDYEEETCDPDRDYQERGHGSRDQG